jgi:hypothetical protein
MEYFHRILDTINDLNSTNNNYFTEKYYEKLDSCILELEKAIYAPVSLDRDSFFDMLKKFISTTEKSIIAVSDEVNDGTNFWSSQKGKVLLRENIYAINNSDVTCKRIFIVNNDATNCPILKKAMSLQKKDGIDVYVVSIDALPDSDIDDFIILDGKVLFAFSGDSGIFTVDRVEIEKYIKKYNFLLSTATPFQQKRRRG